MGATASIHSLNGSREVSINEFCTGPGSTILKNNEIVVSINIPAPKQNSGAHYMRFTPRNEMDIAVVGVGTSVELSDDGSTFKDVQVALASVAPTPLHVTSITDFLSGKDINDEKNSILEIRAGTGGDEASLFAADLFGMYQKYSNLNNWSFEILSISETGLNGIKEVICNISGKSVFSKLKYESGVHRVQRIPLTETSGRVHTSAATVAVLPEAEEINVKN